MTEQKKNLSKLCLAGFILSFLPLVLMGLGICLFFLMVKTDNYDLVTFLSIVIAVFPLIAFVMELIGLGLSIAGVVTASREGRRGKGLGITGIVIPNLYATAVFVLIGLIVFGIVSGINTSSRNRKNSDVYNMGSVYEHQNTEYDVSRYQILEGYKLNSQDNPSSESELKRFAGGRLDTISKENDICIKGTREKYTFLIIRRDRFSDWSAIDRVGGVTYYPDGYATIQYDYMWEFSAGHACTLDMYKDPSDKYILITNCDDYKVITEFFAK